MHWHFTQTKNKQKGMHHCSPLELTFIQNESQLTSLLNINMSKIVNEKITEEHIEEARRLEDDPQKILALIDIIFMNEDKSKIIPS